MKNLWQFIKFGIVGVSNTLISQGIYSVLVFFKVPYLLAYFIGFVLSVLNAYYWSNKYVFKSDPGQGERVWWKVLIKTYVAYLWGFIVSSVLLVVWVDLVQLSRYMGGFAGWFAEHGVSKFDADFLGQTLAAVINLFITVPMNFLVNKFWAYK
ncbi:MAG: GtrA family protein, partial [Blautia sp.]|nr:GtrA family protein [Blautia sp.]